jgi:hypothetical protein
MVMLSNQGSQQKNINFTNPFSNLSQDPAIQQGLLGNWAFNFANQGDNGGRSFFENFANFPQQNQNGFMFGNQHHDKALRGWSDKLLSAYDSHLSTPNLQADILFQDTFMGGNNNKKQDLGWGLLT